MTTPAPTHRNPDRVDLVIHSQGVTVTRFWHQDGRDVPSPDGAELKPVDFPLADAIAWLKANGYTVRQWPNGARAFRGQPWPIRNTAGILRRRAEVEALAQAGRLPSSFAWSALDFAYDL